MERLKGKQLKPHPSSEAEGAWLDRRKFYRGITLTSSVTLTSLLPFGELTQKCKATEGSY